MFDAKKLLDQMMGAAENIAGKENIDRAKAAIAGNPGMAKAAGVGLAVVLLGTKAGRSVSGRVVKLGGLAAVGGLAYKAYQNWQAKQGVATGTETKELAAPPADSLFATKNANEQDRARTCLVAMISAAKADGHIDADEQKRIFGRMNEMIAGTEAKAFLMDEMTAPNDIGRVVKLATSHERAVEIYTASCWAIDLDQADEQAWLEGLAKGMKLEPALTEEIEKAVKQERALA